MRHFRDRDIADEKEVFVLDDSCAGRGKVGLVPLR